MFGQKKTFKTIIKQLVNTLTKGELYQLCNYYLTMKILNHNKNYSKTENKLQLCEIKIIANEV